MSEQALIKQGIVMPAVTATEAVEAFAAYQDLANKITTPDDIQIIQGKNFKKKSFWRKCQRFFNLSVEKMEERFEDHGNIFIYHFVFRAIAPNGSYCDGSGSCSSDEKGLPKTHHNARAIAETRAKNRAISDLVAFGEVSAEEVDPHENHFESSRSKGKSGKVISESQRKRLYAISKKAGMTDNDVVMIIKPFGYEKTNEITMDDYDEIVKSCENWQVAEELEFGDEYISKEDRMYLYDLSGKNETIIKNALAEMKIKTTHEIHKGKEFADVCQRVKQSAEAKQ